MTVSTITVLTLTCPFVFALCALERLQSTTDIAQKGARELSSTKYCPLKEPGLHRLLRPWSVIVRPYAIVSVTYYCSLTIVRLLLHSRNNYSMHWALPCSKGHETARYGKFFIALDWKCYEVQSSSPWTNVTCSVSGPILHATLNSHIHPTLWWSPLHTFTPTTPLLVSVSPPYDLAMNCLFRATSRTHSTRGRILSLRFMHLFAQTVSACYHQSYRRMVIVAEKTTASNNPWSLYPQSEESSVPVPMFHPRSTALTRCIFATCLGPNYSPSSVIKHTLVSCFRSLQWPKQPPGHNDVSLGPLLCVWIWSEMHWKLHWNQASILTTNWRAPANDYWLKVTMKSARGQLLFREDLIGPETEIQLAGVPARHATLTLCPVWP